MKTLFAVALALVVSSNAIAAGNDSKCKAVAAKAALALESLSQKKPMNRLKLSSVERTNRVRSGGEFLDTYEVGTVDSDNDGFSRYSVKVTSTDCIIEQVKLESQD